MEKLSGLVLDIWDDQENEILPHIGLEGIVKNASISMQKVTPELCEKLPDDLFALVLHDGDVTLRKFACIDSGHTAVNVGYFLKTGHKLPVEAQKLAAQNLVKACGWYDIEPPVELAKVALGLGTLAMGAMVAPGMMTASKQNLAAVKGAGGQIVTPMQRDAIKMTGAR